MPLYSQLLLCLLLSAAAEEPRPVPQELDIPYLKARPELSARANDASWDGAAFVETLNPAWRDPEQPPGPSALPTETRIGWDENALYLRFIVSDNDIWNDAKQHDDAVYLGDCMEIFIDAVGDALAVSEIQISPTGVVFDQMNLLTAPPRYQSDGRLEWDLFRNMWFMTSWDCQDLRVVTHATEHGWIADVAIPAKALLQRSGMEHLTPNLVVRANMVRVDSRSSVEQKRESHITSWSPVLAGCQHFSQGRLGFLRLMKP